MLFRSPAFNWREVRDAESGYAVLLPAKPASMTREIDLDGMRVSMTMTGARTEQCLFSVAVASLGADDEKLRQHALVAMRTAMLRNVGAMPVEPGAGTVMRVDASGATTGRLDAVTIEAAGRVAGDPVILHAVFVAQGDRALQAVAITPPREAAQARTMLDSFRIIR